MISFVLLMIAIEIVQIFWGIHHVVTLGKFLSLGKS